MKNTDRYLIIWHLFWIGVIVYSSGEKWVSTISSALIGVFLGIVLITPSFRNHLQRGLDLMDRINKLNGELLEWVHRDEMTIASLTERNELLEDGEGWKDGR